MDWSDPSIASLHNLPGVPVDRSFRNRKNRNFKKRFSSALEAEKRSGEENMETEASEKQLLEIKMKLAESTGAVESNKARDFVRFDDLFSGDLPCILLYLDGKSSRLRAFKTFDELSKFINTADENPSTTNDKVIEMLQCAPARRLVHYTTLGKYLLHLYKDDRFMDVHIDVNGTSFMAHRIALCCYSGYFKNLFYQEKMKLKIPIKVKIFGVSVEAFAAFIEYVYTGRLCIYQGIVGDIIYLSEYLDVKTLRDQLNSIIGSLTLEQAIKLLLRPCDPSGKLFHIALSMIIKEFNAASMTGGFFDLNVEVFCSIIKSDNLCVSREYEVFRVVVRWIVHGGKGRVPYISRVMNNIRFCYMTAEELFDCLEETSLFFDHTDLRDLLLIANWVQTAMQLNKSDPFNFFVPPRRTRYTKHHQSKTLKQERCHHPLYHTKENDTSAARPSENSSQGKLPFSRRSSKPSGKQPFPKPPNDLYTCPLNEKSSSPRYEQPLMIHSDLIGDISTKRQVEPILTPTESLENVIQHSPKFAKPFILPPELQLPLHNSTSGAPVKNSFQLSTSSSAEQIQVTSLTQISSQDSPNADHSSLQLDDMSAIEFQKVIAPEEEINLSNHSWLYAKPLMLPPTKDFSGVKCKDTHDVSIGESSTKRQVKPTPTGGLKNVIQHSPKFAKPVILPLELQLPLNKSTTEAPVSDSVQLITSFSSGQIQETSWTQISSKGSSPNQSSPNENYCSLQLDDLSTKTSQKAVSPKAERNLSNLYRRCAKPIMLPQKGNFSEARLKNTHDVSTPKRTQIQQVNTLPRRQPITYGKPLLLPPNTAPVEFRMKPAKKCDCRPAISPAGHTQPTTWWQNPTESDRKETEPVEVKNKQSIQHPKMSPVDHVKPTIWSPNWNQCSNPAAYDDLSTSTDNTSSSTGDEEFVDALDVDSQSSETQQWFEAMDHIELASKEEGYMSKPFHQKIEGIQTCLSPGIEKHDVPPEENKSFLDMSKLVPKSPDIIVVGCLEEVRLLDKIRIGGQRVAVEFCKMPEPRHAFAVARVGQKVYVIGGHKAVEGKNGRKTTDTVLQMDCFARDWVQVASMNEARMSHSACVLDCNIYVFGGLDKYDSPLASCEYYSPRMNTWTTITPTPIPIYAGAAAALGGKCYIAGGMTHYADEPTHRLIMTMISYDPENKKWSVPGYLRMPICHAALVNVQGRLLLCGGATYRNDKTRRRELVSVGMIDEYNILTNSWHFRSKMAIARQEACAVAVGSKLYVVGGKRYADGNIVESVECYDTSTSGWKDCEVKIPPTGQDIKCLSCQNMK